MPLLTLSIVLVLTALFIILSLAPFIDSLDDINQVENSNYRSSIDQEEVLL